MYCRWRDGVGLVWSPVSGDVEGKPTVVDIKIRTKIKKYEQEY